MPNVTISVPEGLKTEMDALSEVNWSEICRKAISRYIAERKNPTPSIELDLREVRLRHYSNQTGYPTLNIPLRIHNKMGAEITVDRILFNVQFVNQDGYSRVVGHDHFLHKIPISSHSIGRADLFLKLPNEKIAELKHSFVSTFRCDINCVVFVEDFRDPYRAGIATRIPIDEWNELVKKVLGELM